MGIERIILVRATALCANVALVTCALLLSACGQKGPLTLPNDPEFKQRATLPDIVRRELQSQPSPASAPPPAANSPSPSPAPAASSPAGR